MSTLQTPARARAISSFTIIKGSLIAETYAAFRRWDLARSTDANLHDLKAANTVAARSANWLRDVAFVIGRRFDPPGRDRSLVELAQAGCDHRLWDPILLWHMTRDEFLLRDFLANWVYTQFSEGIYRLHAKDVEVYLAKVRTRRGVTSGGPWTQATTSRVAVALLRIAQDFGLLSGTVHREFRPYHLPDPALLYLLHAVAELTPNAAALLASPDWQMYRLDGAALEAELLRLHQFRHLHYETAGTLAQLRLPCRSAAEYARTMIVGTTRA